MSAVGDAVDLSTLATFGAAVVIGASASTMLSAERTTLPLLGTVPSLAVGGVGLVAGLGLYGGVKRYSSGCGCTGACDC